jgi:hypothetical protein
MNLLRKCSLLLRKEVIHIKKFSALLRMLFSGHGSLLGLNLSRPKICTRFKAAKDRFTLLLGCNAEGDYKLKPGMV